jgi:flagellar hook-basal body complex protein FliE
MAIGPIGPQLPGSALFKPPTPRIAAAAEPTTGGIGSAPSPGLNPPLAGGPGAAASSFSQLFTDAVGQIDKLQKGADGNIQKLATGQPVDLHDVTISMEQSNLGFQLGMQVRNKLIEAYQEVMRMPV